MNIFPNASDGPTHHCFSLWDFADFEHYKLNHLIVILIFAVLDCKPGYETHGNLCYKKMNRRPWVIAKCLPGDQFVSAENEDENKFIYDTFVEPSKEAFWMHARICGERKLCQQDYGPVFYNNVEGDLPNSGCVQLPYGRGMKWVIKSCKTAAFYVCKYGEYLQMTNYIS